MQMQYDKTHIGWMVTCFQKRTSLDILIAGWLHKTYTLSYAQTRETITVSKISNTEHC